MFPKFEMLLNVSLDEFLLVYWHIIGKLHLQNLSLLESFSFTLRINVSCMCHQCIRNVS